MSMTTHTDIEDIMTLVRQLPPAERATLVTEIVQTLVEQTTVNEEGVALLRPEDYETDEMRQMHLQWEAERAAGTLDQDEDISWMDSLSQQKLISRMKAEWKATTRAREAALANEPLPPPRDTLSEAYGLLETGVPGPSDEEAKQWLQERRMKKYG